MECKTIFARLHKGAVILSCIAAVIFAYFALFACGNSDGGTPDIVGIYAQDVYAEYDGKAYGITVNNLLDGDKVFYKTSASGDWSEVAPSYAIPGVYEIEYKVERTGHNAFIGVAQVTIAKTVLGGISSAKETIIYDGIAHGITVEGLLPTDRVVYSVDGVDFYTDAPMWSEAGEYKVYFAVEREYGEYRGSGILVILPDISGRYLNAAHGVIELTPTGATINGKSVTLEYDHTATGRLGEYDFTITDSSLSYRGDDYAKIDVDDIVYTLNVNDEKVYFAGEKSVEKLTVAIKSDGAEIAYNGRRLITVSGVNYCETGILTDYVELSFEIPLEQAETTVAFSRRERQPDRDLTAIAVYDGDPHGFDLGEEYVFLTENGSYSEIGKHTATVVELSEIYLPEVRTATLVILPMIAGVYMDETTAVEVTSEYVTLNGNKSELNKTADGWAADGKSIVVTPDGIAIDGKEYTRTSDRVLLVEIGDMTHTARFEWVEDAFLSVRKVGNVIEISYSYQALAEIEVDGEVVKVTTCGATAPRVELNGSTSFISGASELDYPVVYLVVVVE